MNQVSICIPTYNGAEFLDECIASARGQSYPDLEILIIDDRSSDQSTEIALHHANEDARVRVVQNDVNQGLVGNWNRCIELARGSWIKFLFQDDLLDPRCVELLMERAAEDGSRFVACERDFIFDSAISESMRLAYLRNKQVIHEFLGPNRGASPSQYANRILRKINYNYIGEPTVTLIHTSVFKEFGLFSSELSQICDLEYWAKVVSNIGVGFVPQTLATFRAHASGTSAVNRKSKSFRASGLDPLVLLSFMLERREYAHMREIWRRDGLYKGVLRQMRTRANEVREYVGAHAGVPFGQWTVAEEYEDFLSRFPRCRIPVLAHLRWRITTAPYRVKYSVEKFVANLLGRSIEQPF